MIYTKKMIADRVIDKLMNDFPNIDFRIDIRSVFLAVDDIINKLAKQNYLENFKFYGGIDDAFTTVWDGANALTVTDVVGQPSYITLPAIPVALPNNGGIIECWPLNYKYQQVRIRRHEDVRRTSRLMSGNMQGQLGGYPKYPVFEFDQIEVSKKYATRFGMKMCVKDSKDIAVDAPFPIAADAFDQIIKEAYVYFQEKRLAPTDVIRDGRDALTRN